MRAKLGSGAAGKQEVRATVAAVFAERLIAAAEARGVDARSLWKSVGVTASEVRRDPLLRIEHGAHLALWERVRRETRDPAIALAYARSKSVDDYGLLGLACKTADDVKSALELLIAYAGIYAENFSFVLEPRPAGAELVVSVTGRKGEGLRCQLESAVAEIWQSILEMVGPARTLELDAVSFVHDAPRAVAPYALFFGRAPRFGAKENRMRFSEAALSAPLLRSDPALHRYLTGVLAQAARSVSSSHGVTSVETERVRRAIFQILPRALRVSVVAHALGMSARSLQRRLDAEGTSFDLVVDETRREIADAMLADPRTTLAEVAAATGLSEASAFSRAYKRWTGRSPRRPSGRRAPTSA